MAVVLVAGIEGGFILSRTARNADLLRATGRQMSLALRGRTRPVFVLIVGRVAPLPLARAHAEGTCVSRLAR